jgi:hypothetical protein
MKKILLILLVFVSLVCSGQMKMTTHTQENAFGYLVNYIRFESETPTKNELIILHGIGERGPADGSQLPLVLKYGFGKHAQAGFKFPFNITCVQVENSYATVRRFLPAYIKLKYKAEVIIVTGLSMGGYGAFETKLFDYLNLVYAIAPIAGGMNASNAATYPKVKGWVAHGDKDTVVKYTSSKNFVDAYNKLHPDDPMQYTLYAGIGHNSWDKAYSVTPGQDELLQWIKARFNEAPKEGSCDEMKSRVQVLLQVLRRSKNDFLLDMDTAIFHLEESIK